MTEARVRAVVFDLDGTLVDSREAVIDAVASGVREVARRHGHGDVEIDESVLIGALGQPSREYFRAILPRRLVDLADEVKEVATRHEVEALQAAGREVAGGAGRGPGSPPARSRRCASGAASTASPAHASSGTLARRRRPGARGPR